MLGFEKDLGSCRSSNLQNSVIGNGAQLDRVWVSESGWVTRCLLPLPAKVFYSEYGHLLALSWNQTQERPLCLQHSRAFPVSLNTRLGKGLRFYL